MEALSSDITCDKDDTDLPTVFLWGSRGLVWNAKDVLRLRRDHRVMGKLIGSPPHAPLQMQSSSLPLLLSPEELSLVVEKKVANVLKVHNLNGPMDDEERATMQRFYEENFEEQVQVCLNEKREQILKQSDTIVNGKKRKLMRLPEEDVKRLKLADDSQLVEQELEKIKPIGPQQKLVQVFLEPKWLPSGLNYTKVLKAEISRPRSKRDIVYSDLWSRGFFLTSGTKFGVDFLAYTADPILNHAKYLVVCDNSSDDKALLMTKARLAHSVNKSLLVAKVEEPNQKVVYELVSAVIAKRTRR